MAKEAGLGMHTTGVSKSSVSFLRLILEWRLAAKFIEDL